MINEIECRQNMTRAWLEAWIDNNEKPDWFDWFGFYPAKSSVNAAKAQLNAMNDFGLLVDTKQSFGIFNQSGK